MLCVYLLILLKVSSCLFLIHSTIYIEHYLLIQSKTFGCLNSKAVIINMGQNAFKKCDVCFKSIREDNIKRHMKKQEKGKKDDIKREGNEDRGRLLCEETGYEKKCARVKLYFHVNLVNFHQNIKSVF